MKAFKFLSKTAFVFSLVLLASCSSDNNDIEETVNEAKTVAKKIEFKANIVASDSSDVTRATLEDDYSITWDENDMISVYCDNDEQVVEFNITPSSIDGTTATFTNYGDELPSWFDAYDSYYALYPNVTATLFNPNTSMISSVMPANQTVSGGRTYDKKALFMTACADKDERVFNFLNIPALIRVTLNNNADGKVKFIEIASDTKADNLSGNFRASAVYARNRINFEAISGAEKKNMVRLQIPASEESKDFFIAVLPGTINGFTLKFEDSNYKTVYERHSDKKPMLKSSKVYNFGSYDASEM